jgi:predicted alpha/beta-fold hydrolase
MVRRFRKKVGLFPEIYSLDGVDRIRSMRDFDHNVVARYGGFADADDYYATVGSSRWADRLAVPTLIIHAIDDPFIRMLSSTRATLLANRNVTFLETPRGGHCAFLSSEAGMDRHWAEKTLVTWLVGVAG